MLIAVVCYAGCDYTSINKIFLHRERVPQHEEQTHGKSQGP